MIDRYADRQGEFARRFFLLATAVYCAAFGLASVLIHFAGRTALARPAAFPRIFWISTLLLIAGSGLLQRARYHVRIERQRKFRRSLVLGLAVGTLFVAAQSYALWCLAGHQERSSAAASTGTGAFVIALASLHGLHFTVALLCLVFVTLRALADRYDHEYYWGVTVCAYFWHGLAVVWMAILAVLMMAGGASQT